MIDVLIMGGTWAPQGHPVTNAFADALDRDRFNPRHVPYPADYGQRVTFADSVIRGRQALIQAIRNTPNPVIVAGYSQGAGIAGDVAAEWGNGFHSDLDIRGAALIADPARPQGVSINPDPGGHGITGERFIEGMPVWHVAAWNDPITSLPAGSPLRTLADLSAYWSINSPTAFLEWGRSALWAVQQRRLQRWWHPLDLMALTSAVTNAKGYLLDGRHTDAYVREGLSAQLAEAVNREVS